MKWNWIAFLIYCFLLALLSLAGAWILGQLMEDKKLVFSESQQVSLAIFLGSLGASLILSIVGAFRRWRLSHFLAAVALIAALLGGNVAAATVIVVLTAIVSLLAEKIVQVFFYYFSAAEVSLTGHSDQDETVVHSNTDNK